MEREALFFQEQIQGLENASIARFQGLCCYQNRSEKSLKKSPVWPGFLSFVKGQAACQALRRRSFSPASPARASAPKVSASG